MVCSFDEFESFQDQPRKEQADLSSSSEHLRNKLRANRHELENAKIEHENAEWEFQELKKNPKKGFPADNESTMAQAKGKIEDLEVRKKELEDAIASDQKKKDDLDQKRKQIEQSQGAKNDSQNQAAGKSSNIGNKIWGYFKNGALNELNNQLEPEKFAQTLGSVVGSNLVYGGIKMAAVLQNEDVNPIDVDKVIQETLDETALTIAASVILPVAWEGVREIAVQTLPESCADNIPSLGTAVKTYHVANAALNSKDAKEAVTNVAYVATDLVLLSSCQYVGGIVGGGVGSMIPIPVVGTFIGSVAGGAFGTASYVGSKMAASAVKKWVYPPAKCNDRVMVKE